MYADVNLYILQRFSQLQLGRLTFGLFMNRTIHGDHPKKLRYGELYSLPVSGTAAPNNCEHRQDTCFTC